MLLDLPVVPKKVPKKRYVLKTEKYCYVEPSRDDKPTRLHYAARAHCAVPVFLALICPPNRCHDAVNDYALPLLPDSLDVKVGGNLLSQSDQTALMHFLHFATTKMPAGLPNSHVKTVIANTLLKNMGYDKPGQEQYIWLKSAFMRMSWVTIAITYDGMLIYSGSLLSVSDCNTDKQIGPVCYDTALTDKRLGRLDRFAVTIPNAIVRLMHEESMRTYIPMESRKIGGEKYLPNLEKPETTKFDPAINAFDPLTQWLLSIMSGKTPRMRLKTGLNITIDTLLRCSCLKIGLYEFSEKIKVSIQILKDLAIVDRIEYVKSSTGKEMVNLYLD